MLLSMPEVMLNMIAFGLEYIVVLVFDLPACPPISHDRFDGGIGNFKISG
jgi:hypothetical protein